MNHRLIHFICYPILAGILLLSNAQAAHAFGGDRRAENRWYTEQLRSFLWQMDKAVSQRLSGSDTNTVAQRLQELGEIVRERLVLTRQDEFDRTLAQFMGHLVVEKAAEPASDDIVYGDFKQLRDTVYRLYRVRTLPSQNPDRALAQRLYVQHCAACHGPSGRGDGILAQNTNAPMDPAPTDFIALNKLGVRNAYSYFNSMFAGNEGTSMRAFNETLTSHEIWSLAFFILSDEMREDDMNHGKQKFELDLDLQTLSTQSDRDFLSNREENLDDSGLATLNWIRNHASFRGAIPRKR